MPNITVKATRISVLSILLIMTQLGACSSEKDINGVGAADIGSGAVVDDIADTGVDTGTGTTLPPTLSWVAPSVREDNTPISLSEIAGYRIYYGATQGDYPSRVEINDVYNNQMDPSNLNLPSGDYYIVITTIDTDGRESAYSEEVVLNI